MIAQNIELLRSGFMDYSGGSLLWILYAVSLVYLGIFAGKEGRKLVVWPFVIAAVTLFNPLLIRFIASKLHVLRRVPRLYWLLIYYIVIAYAFVHLIGRLRKRWMQAAAFAAAAALIICLGNPVFAAETGFPYSMPENTSFVSGRVIELCNIYHSEGIAEPKVLYESELMQSVRTYDPSIRSEATRDLTVTLEQKGYVKESVEEDIDRMTIVEVFFLENYDVPTEGFLEALKARQIDYVTTRNGSGQDAYMALCGMKMAGMTGEYHVWKTGVNNG
ncbi:MAG: hypothetical protein E7240_03585 [Lachnospiraceae bacterium]|nr:hypothetical protein [Lachnospiraceae bacterium]